MKFGSERWGRDEENTTRHDERVGIHSKTERRDGTEEKTEKGQA